MMPDHLSKHAKAKAGNPGGMFLLNQVHDMIDARGARQTDTQPVPVCAENLREAWHVFCFASFFFFSFSPQKITVNLGRLLGDCPEGK